MRESGKICAICGRSLPAPHTPGERRCMACGGKRRVYMAFFQRDGWYCQFLEADLKTPLPRKFNFKTAEKILQLADHGGALQNLEARQMIDHAISTGRGGVWLDLTEEQYQKLKTG
jgi:hypothetical protein